MNFYESYQQTKSRGLTPAKTFRREIVYPKSDSKKDTKLNMMKELCAHGQKGRHMNSYSAKPKQGTRPQSVDMRSHHNMSFDTSIMAGSPPRVELSKSKKQPVLSDDQMISLFQAR